MMLGGLDPQLVAEIQALLGPQANLGLPALSKGTAGVAPAMPPAPPPDDQADAWDVFTGILTSPFRLVGAAKRGLEDAVGHPNAMAREQQDAEYDATLKYLLASQSIPDDIKQMLPLPPPDRSGYIARQTDPHATATGRDNSMLPVPTARKTGIYEWITGEDRRQRARDEATMQAALKLAGYDLDLQKDQAEVRRITTAGDSNQANALKTDFETKLLYRYGDDDWMSRINENRAQAESARASAASSYASRDATRDRNARENEYYEQVRLPTGLTNLDQRGQYHDLRQRTGEERLRQMQAQGPVDLQTKQARLAREGGVEGGIPRDYLSAVKGINTAVNQARDDAVKNKSTWPIGPWSVDEKAVADPIYRQFGVTMTEAGEPDWEGYVERFHAKPTAAVPGTAAAPTVSTKPTGAARYRVYDLLKKHLTNLDDGVISARADLISEAMPTLDFSSEDAFLDSGELAGLNDEEMVLLWNDRNRP